jgi:hypothetical protein
MRHRKKDSISTLPQAATTVASAWAPSVDASSTVPAASAESGAVRKCHVCKELVVTYAGLEIKLRALDASSRCGCPSCLLIARVLEEYGVKLTTDDNVYLFVEGESTLKLRFDSLNDKGTTEEFDIFIPQGRFSYIRQQFGRTKYTRHHLPMAVYRVETHSAWEFDCRSRSRSS